MLLVAVGWVIGGEAAAVPEPAWGTGTAALALGVAIGGLQALALRPWLARGETAIWVGVTAAGWAVALYLNGAKTGDGTPWLVIPAFGQWWLLRPRLGRATAWLLLAPVADAASRIDGLQILSGLSGIIDPPWLVTVGLAMGLRGLAYAAVTALALGLSAAEWSFRDGSRLTPVGR